MRGEITAQRAELLDYSSLDLAKHWRRLRFIVRTFSFFLRGEHRYENSWKSVFYVVSMMETLTWPRHVPSRVSSAQGCHSLQLASCRSCQLHNRIHWNFRLREYYHKLVRSVWNSKE